MGRIDASCSQVYKTESSHTATDAACFNAPSYTSNCRGSSGEDISSRLSSEHEENQPVQYAYSRDLVPRRKDSCLYYDMSGDKMLIIFNHFKFMKRKHPNSLPREGTYEDVISLKETFHRLGFMVVIHDDWTYKDIMKYLNDICKRDHSNTSCVAVAVMTHGKGSRLYAADRKYPVSDITDKLRSAPSLAGKPKLFFLQACRAEHTRHKPRDKDETDFSLNVDCLVLYSCYEDHYSFRHPKEGSWMMQALCQVINAHHDTLNLVQMVTLVNKKVSRMKSVDMKQMPVAEYTLNKFLKF